MYIAYKRHDNVSGSLRRDIIQNQGVDIYTLCETHLQNNDILAIDGYKWFL